MTCVLTAERGGDIIFPSDRRQGGIETDDPTFKSLNWDWTEKLRVMDTTNILLDILLFVKDIKSNNNIFDRNREYMTRNRWLNKQRLPSPRYGLRYWCSRRNGQGTRTQVLLGKSKLWNICQQDLANRLNWFVNQVLFTQNESSWTTSRNFHIKMLLM